MVLTLPPVPPPYVCVYAPPNTEPCIPPTDTSCPYVTAYGEPVLGACVKP